MKKEYKLWLLGIITIFCLFSFQIALAENTKINYTDKQIQEIVNRLKKTDTRVAEIEKAREKLDKDNDARNKQLQDSLKSLNSRVDSNIKSGFYCVQPTKSCDEATYQRIRGNAISSGLTPDASQLSQCRAQIDEYNTKLQAYNKCQQDYINNSIGSSAKMESESEQYRYKTEILNKNTYCIGKEGRYSSYNEKTKECECVEGSTFINGQCKSKARIHLDNYVECVTNYGPLSKYNDEKDSCECTEGSVFDFKKLSCVEGTVQEPYIEASEKNSEVGYVSVSELKKNTKASTKNEFLDILKQEKPSQKDTEKVQGNLISSESAKVESIPNNPPNDIAPVVQKPTFWQNVKKAILKIKFW